MSRRTDVADAIVLYFAGRFMRAEDPDRRARLFSMAQAATRAWRRVYAHEAKLSRMRAADRAKARHR